MRELFDVELCKKVELVRSLFAYQGRTSTSNPIQDAASREEQNESDHLDDDHLCVIAFCYNLPSLCVRSPVSGM